MLRQDGVRFVAGKLAAETAHRILDGTAVMDLGIPREHLLGPSQAPPPPVRPPTGPLVVNFVITAPWLDSGGTTTTFRIIRFLLERGHTCRIYIAYSPMRRTFAQDRATIQKHLLPGWKTEILDADEGFAPADVIFATAWPTAYLVRQSACAPSRFYLVQDFEPSLYATSSRSTLAEETYRFGFHGLTAGRWLADKLDRDYGMTCDSFDLGVDLSNYRLENHGPRRGVVFYARPSTPRRGFELGMLTLELFHAQHPEVEIHLVGQALHVKNLGFPATCHGVLTPGDLARLYNRCAAGLVFSLTNLSLLPAELLATGCIPVVNDGPNNRASLTNPHIRYSRPHPSEMARALSAVFEARDMARAAEEAARSVSNLSWDHIGDTVEQALYSGLAQIRAEGRRTA